MKNNSMFWTVLKHFFVQKREQAYTNKNKNITFEYDGRSGYAIYRDGNKTTRFYTEVGGGDCIFYIVIPTAEQWSSETGYPSIERDVIIKYVAEESLKKQPKIHGTFYNIADKHIVFFQK